MSGRVFTKAALDVIHRAARLAEDENYFAWDPKKEAMLPAIDAVHLHQAALNRLLDEVKDD